MYLVQDIEAVPENEILDMWLEEEKKREAEGKSTKMPDLWAFKIICIGMLVLDRDLKPVQGGCARGGVRGGQSERDMIQRWSDVASGKHTHHPEPLRMVDWNGRAFDVPCLQTRAFRYGIQLDWLFGLQPDNRGQLSTWSKEYRDRYQGKHDDVAELWTCRGAFRQPHLANLARLMGLPGKVGIDGSKIHDVWKSIPVNADAAAEIDIYCMQDVIQTAFVFQRFRYMSGKMTIDQYRAAAAALVLWTEKQEEHRGFVERIDRDALLLLEGVSSGNANADDRRDHLVPPGGGSEPALAPVQGPADLHPEGSL